MGLGIVGNQDGTITITCGDTKIRIAIADYMQASGNDRPIVWPPKDAGAGGLGTCLHLLVESGAARMIENESTVNLNALGSKVLLQDGIRYDDIPPQWLIAKGPDFSETS